jgi:hypothetical protein
VAQGAGRKCFQPSRHFSHGSILLRAAGLGWGGAPFTG